jgi:hypothetical protein
VYVYAGKSLTVCIVSVLQCSRTLLVKFACILTNRIGESRVACMQDR